MKNIIGYAETEMRRFDKKAFCAVDSLVFSQLSYVRFEQIVPPPSRGAKPVRIGDLPRAEHFGAMFRWLSVENNRALLVALAASPRFRDVLAGGYVSRTDPDIGRQFSAITFILGDGTAYVAFRGTDETFVGWKEDLNMAVFCPVPAQQEAAAYLNETASLLPRSLRLRVGGHSKGGNLAVYAAMTCEPAVQERIAGVYNHDGPGFRKEVTCSPEFRRIEGRIQKTLPKASLIGLLLHDQERYAIVESSVSGLMQHDPFSWAVGDGDFVYTDKLTNGSKIMSRALDQWLGTLTDEKRKVFVDTLFGVLEASGAASFTELSEKGRKSAAMMLASLKNIDPEIRKFVSRTVSDLIRLSLKSLRQNSGETPRRKPAESAAPATVPST
jgi:hypothetical protein